MSTNYYLVSKPCPHCKHLPRDVHLGKSSLGWCFSLHVIPECGIDDLNSMIEWLTGSILDGSTIINEYKQELALNAFLDIVTKRSNPRIIRDGWDSKWWYFGGSLKAYSYASEEDFHRLNHSKRGPSGLLRHQVDGNHCIGNGVGTWDLITGEFS